MTWRLKNQYINFYSWFWIILLKFESDRGGVVFFGDFRQLEYHHHHHHHHHENENENVNVNVNVGTWSN